MVISCYRCNEDFEAVVKQNYERSCPDCRAADRTARRLKKRKLISRWKVSKGCHECGYDKHPAALHLAHRQMETKATHSSAGINYGWSKARIKEELAKVDVKCANCHAIQTCKEMRGW